VILGSAGAATAAARSRAALIAVAPRSVTLDAKGRAKVTVRNRFCQRVRLAATLRTAKGRRISGAVVSVPGHSLLKRHRSVRIAITARSLKGLARLVVSARGPGRHALLVRVRVTVVPHPAPPHLTASPAVGTWTIRWVRYDDTIGQTFPLTGPCRDLGLRAGQTVGTVQAAGVAVTITSRCIHPTDHTVELMLGTIPWVGRSYSGKISLGPTSSADVTLTVEVTTAWELAAGLILVGIIIAIAVAQWQGWRRDVTMLLRRTYVLQQLISPHNPHNADAEFRAAAAAANLPANVQEWTIADAVKDALRDARNGLRAQRSATDPATTDVKTTLDELEQQVRAWPQTANVLAELVHRTPRLVSLTMYVAHVAQLTLGRAAGALPLADADTITKTAQEANALAADWPADEIEKVQALVNELRANDPARGQLDGALARLGAAGTVADARDALDEFWSVDTAVRAALAAGQPNLLAAVGLPAAGAFEWAGLFTPVEVQDPAATERGLAIRIFLFDWVVLLILVIVAVVTGMQALYIGKTFGGAADVISALAWGLGSGAVATVLSGAVAGARNSLSLMQGTS
jgi:hypothetical protein